MKKAEPLSRKEISRRAREKRKRVYDDLVNTNKRLREEREEFLKHITKLETELAELRNSNNISLAMENEMLNLQMEEHQVFS